MMTKNHDMQLAVSAGSLEEYISCAMAMPVLSFEEEQALARQWQLHQDLESARQLVLSQLRFVVYIAKGYSGYGLPQADLIQEGNIGLMKAVKRFDPKQNVRLISFAVHWIRAEIHEFILRNWRIVKIATTKAQRKLFFNLRSSKRRLGWFNKEEVDAVANDLGVSSEAVVEMEKRLSGQDVAFDVNPEEREDRPQLPAPSAYLTDQRLDPALVLESEEWELEKKRQLAKVMSDLDPRSQEIVARRWLSEKKATLHELAAEYGVSAERIRQIENNAMKKMRAAMAVD